MYRLTIKMGYQYRDYLYSDDEVKVMTMIIRNLAEHEVPIEDRAESQTKFTLEYEPDKTVTIAKGTNGEVIEIADE